MIHLKKGDITSFEGEAIVNAANSSLQGGGGVDGAIHRAGGPLILEQCKAWVKKHGELPTGEAMLTSGGNLQAKWIIHTVGPVWKDGAHDEDLLLANCYINSLRICHEKGLKTVAFPNISTGVYRFPKPDAADVAIASVRNFLSSDKVDIEVSFYCFDDENFELYKKLIK
ncbi:MAG: O-acetyl-ADP-ribose deacetylase [Owenweeksia sp.]